MQGGAFVVIALDGSYASGVAATVDMLAAAQTLQRQAKVPPLRAKVCSLAGGAVRLSSGLSIATRRLGATSPSTCWVVPGLGVDDFAAVEARLAQPDATRLARALARHVARGGQVAASCSAVFLLQRAGLLAGRRATTTWWLGRQLAQLEPTCTVDLDAMVCADRAVVTAGAAFAQTDLMLHLLRPRCGSAVVERLAQVLLLDGQRAQARYILPELAANGDPVVAKITARVAATLPTPPTVAELARGLAMSERTLSRYILRVTGKRTLALVHSVKVRRAEALLRATKLSVEQVAAAVGCQDAGTLRRLLKKFGGSTPLAYRASRRASR